MLDNVQARKRDRQCNRKQTARFGRKPGDAGGLQFGLGGIAILQGLVGLELIDFGVGLQGLGKNRTLILYCDRGGLSMKAANELKEQGYDARSVVGGIEAYFH